MDSQVRPAGSLPCPLPSLLPWILIGLALLGPGGTASAQPPRDPPRDSPDSFAALVRTDPRFEAREALRPLEDLRNRLAADVLDDWTEVLEFGDWNAYVDARNGRIEAAEGTGIPWIPGAGNRLGDDLQGPGEDGEP
ncbi:MAG TPA: hypothetical protein VN851_11070, partial [Thermoanaerobaculia bacterium]|nr:hypothetical protein [Thermoanaerobaculia bacterium]